MMLPPMTHSLTHAGTLTNIADESAGSRTRRDGARHTENDHGPAPACQRVPVIVTAAAFSPLWAPLLRDGRMESFNWAPSRTELAAVVLQVRKQRDWQEHCVNVLCHGRGECTLAPRQGG